jgi:hypothetical protein
MFILSLKFKLTSDYLAVLKTCMLLRMNPNIRVQHIFFSSLYKVLTNLVSSTLIMLPTLFGPR